MMVSVLDGLSLSHSSIQARFSRRNASSSGFRDAIQLDQLACVAREMARGPRQIQVLIMLTESFQRLHAAHSEKL